MSVQAPQVGQRVRATERFYLAHRIGRVGTVTGTSVEMLYITWDDAPHGRGGFYLSRWDDGEIAPIEPEPPDDWIDELIVRL